MAQLGAELELEAPGTFGRAVRFSKSLLCDFGISGTSGLLRVFKLSGLLGFGV